MSRCPLVEDATPKGLLPTLRLRVVPLFCRAYKAVYSRVRMGLVRWRFAEYGRNFLFDPNGFYTFEHIHVGHDVTLGYRPVLLAALSRIYIGSKVMFGPEVSILAGNHNTSVIGTCMFDVHEKLPENDLDVWIEDDVWVGTKSIILKGVRIGRGSIIAAGSVVTKDIPPYSIAAGTPAQVKKSRWTLSEVLEHELAVYPAERRLSESQLQHLPKSR